VAIWPVSALWLGEPVTARSAVGASGVVLGLALVSIGRLHRVSAPGLFWAGICAVFIAGYHLCYKCALETGAEPTAVFAVALALALPLNVARLGWRGAPRVAAALGAAPLVLGTAGAVSAASFLALLLALARGGAGAVGTLRNTSVIFALLLAWFIGERPSRRQIAGTWCVALGAVLVGWPR